MKPAKDEPQEVSSPGVTIEVWGGEGIPGQFKPVLHEGEPYHRKDGALPQPRPGKAYRIKGARP